VKVIALWIVVAALATTLTAAQLRTKERAWQPTKPTRAWTAIQWIPKGTRLPANAYSMTLRYGDDEDVQDNIILVKPAPGMVAARNIRPGDPYIVGDFRRR
jgi:flagella basal body P-ring formation protein FlgA